MLKFVLSIGLLCLAIGCNVPTPGPSPAPSPFPNPTPSPVIWPMPVVPLPNPVPHINDLIDAVPDQALLLAIRQSFMSGPVASVRQDAAYASNYWKAAADMYDRDQDILKTVSDIREGNIKSQALMLQKTGMTGRYPGLNTAVANYFDKQFQNDKGEIEDMDLTPALRAKGVAAAKTLAWAFNEMTR